MEVEVVKSDRYSGRFIVIDKETGNLLDDAQGYGFKSKQAALKCWTYKQNKSKRAPKNKVKAWMELHADFVEDLEAEIVRQAKIDKNVSNTLINKWLKEEDPNIDFNARDLVKLLEF